MLPRTVKSMRIVCYVHGYPPVHAAGAEYMLHNWVKDLQTRGHTVEVVATAYNLAVTGVFDGVNVTVPKDVREVTRLLQSADVIVTHLNMGAQAVRYGRQLGVPVVHLVHNPAQLPAINVEGGFAVFNSEWVRDAVPFTDPSCVLTPPIAAEHYVTVPRKGREFVTQVNLNIEKGGELFYDLAATMPELKFLGVTGAYGVHPKRAVTPPNVMIVPNGPGIRERVYSRTRVLIQPSLVESWGMAANEAMAAGIPVVVAPTDGLLESVGDAGLYADFGDVEGYRTHLLALQDEEVYMKQAGKVSRRARTLRAATEKQLGTANDYLINAVATHDPNAHITNLTGTQLELLRTGVWFTYEKQTRLIPHEEFQRLWKGRTGVRVL